MELIDTIVDPVSSIHSQHALILKNQGHRTYKSAVEAKQEFIWQQLRSIMLGEAIDEWLSTIQNPCTKKSYTSSMAILIKYRILDDKVPLHLFSLLSPERIVDQIKSCLLFVEGPKNENKQWSIRTREARISCFLAFTRFLSRKTEGIIRRGVPCKDGIEKTFTPKPRKVKTEAMTRSQMALFFEELEKINSRDALIAKICLHGAKRISEVLSLRVDQINYEKKEIVFRQSKSQIADDFTIICFEKESAAVLLEQLRKYIGDRCGIVFVTSFGKQVQKTQVDRTFSEAGRRSNIPFRVSPHNLRATAVTLWKEDGFSDSMIMHASGHSSSAMVHCYDRSDIANNVTKKSCLF